MNTLLYKAYGLQIQKNVIEESHLNALVPLINRGLLLSPIKYANMSLFYLGEKKCEWKMNKRDFPGGPVVKNLPCNAGDTGSTPGLRRSHMPQSN